VAPFDPTQNPDPNALPSPLAPAVGASAASMPPALAPAAPVLPSQQSPGSPEEQQADVDGQDQNDHTSFLSKLGRVAGGAFGAENPNSSPEAHAGALGMGILRAIANGGAMATATTPELKNIAAEQAQVPLKMAQIQNELQYRRALAGIGQQNAASKAITAGASQQNASTNAMKAADTMRLRGYVPDEQTPGTFRPMSPQEVLADPQLSQNQDMKNAAIAAHNAQSQLTTARQQALTNPNSLTQQNFLKSLEEKERVAMAQLALAGRRLEQSQGNQNRQNEEFRLNYGETAPGAPTPAGQPAAPGQNPGSPGGLNLSNAPDMMMVNPSTGIPIPMKMLASLKPTMQEQNRADFAASALHSADKIQQLVDQAKAQVGPFAGRTAELMAKAGLGDQFNQELQNYIRFTQSAATAAHTGRFSVPILEKMDKMIGPEMNPDQLTGAIQSIKSQMAPYADAGWKPSVWEYRAWLGGTGATPSGKTATPPTASGKAVSLAAARALPGMAGKTDAQLTALIKAQGHAVKP
jgi:hypothetical protein